MGISLPARRLISQEDQALVPRPDVPRSKFMGSWSRKMTFDAGFLVPFLIDEVLPGDMLKYDATAMVRTATPLFPLMDSQRVDTFFFFVPARLLWTNWPRFMGEQLNPGDTIAYTIPQVVSPVGGFSAHTIYDHFGIPPGLGQMDGAGTISVNALPFRAYNLIYNQWFRDQNLISSVTVLQTDGPDPVANYALLRRAKSHDYFTSCLPWPQKFTPPTIPLGGLAPVQGLGTTAAAAITNTNVTQTPGQAATYARTLQTNAAGVFVRMTAGNSPDVYADLSQATGVAINTFRNAFLVQELLERDARGGTRYTEIIRAHFGVTSPDMRLQRPEYIGGGSSSVNITPIAQTATGGTGVGALGAAGTAVGEHRASYASTEHGYIIGLINVKTELSYQQGLHRMWTRQTRYDFPFPSLMGLGEQAVLRKELYVRGVPAEDDLVFGYQERWHEYRTRTSEVTGQFRSYVAGTLDGWHLSQRFLVPGNPGYSAPPTLGQTFIQDEPPMSRVFAAGAATANQQYLADILIRREATRPITMYGTPAQLGRF